MNVWDDHKDFSGDALAPDPELDAPAEELTAPDPKVETNDYLIKPLVGDVAGQELQAGGEILITGAEDPHEELNIEPGPITTVYEAPNADRIARGIEVTGDSVGNVLLVAVDKDNNVVGYDVPYGTEIVIVEDDSPIGIGWVRIDGEFVDPEAE